MVGGNAAVSTLTINNALASTLAVKIGGAGANQNNLGLTKAGAGALTVTGANTADVTQVAQLGRYYLPLFLLILPTAVAGWGDWSRSVGLPSRSGRWLAPAFLALLWSDPTWAYDFTWLVKPYQLHWPAIRDAGAWVKDHPDALPPDARIMTWFPWEVRLATRRTTILLPRSLSLSRYEVDRIDETIRQYGVTHVLWGSFEPPPNVDPEIYGPEIDSLRVAVGLVDAHVGRPVAVEVARQRHRKGADVIPEIEGVRPQDRAG